MMPLGLQCQAHVRSSFTLLAICCSVAQACLQHERRAPEVTNLWSKLVVFFQSGKVFPYTSVTEEPVTVMPTVVCRQQYR